MSNKYSDLLMQALDIAIDEKISTLLFDKTILATVLSVVDLDTGEYRVKYKDGIISVFAADPKETFKQGDAVYVTVPEGDFSNKKFISHRITNNSLSTGQYTELANTIFEVSPNFSDLGYTYVPYEEGQDSYGLIVGLNSSINILRSAPALANSRFKAYADLYEYIQISASFYNEFTTDHEIGDYGILLVLTNLDDKLVSYYLNLNDFNGDPYHLSTWSPQSTVIKIPKGLIKALNAIYFYEKGFISEGNVFNLFMSDFSLNFVDKVDLTEVPYYLNILPLDGITFTLSQNSLRLEGQIYHIGEELSETSCIFQWFERDLLVAPGDPAYDKRAGWGWKPIEGSTNKLLIITKEQVPWLKSYKLIVVYNSTTLMTKEITLVNGSLDIDIELVTQGNEIYLKLTKDGYIGDWYYLANDGNLVAIPLSPRSGTSPNIVPYLLYSPMTFYCLIYLEDIYQGELTYVMQNIESKDDVSVVFVGTSLYSYDANGDYGNIYDAQEEKTLSAEIIWRNGVISTSALITWLDFEGNPIRTNLTDPTPYDNHSMIKDVWVDISTNILHYKVNLKYEITEAKNNSFRILISTIDGLVYSFDKEIIFTKTGDPGTNGTRYLSLITIASANKFVGVSNSNTSITLNCKVFKDLTEFTGASVSWQLYNLATVSQSGMSISIKANNNVLKRYVKATITIVDEGKTTTLYDFYPVNSCASLPSIDLSELPKYILYASNGRNPLFKKLVPVIKYNNATATIASEDTTVIKIANNLFKPINEFNPDNPIGLLTVTVSGIIIYHPVPMYINTFGNEAINGWDGVSVDVDNAGGKILAPLVGAGTKDLSTNKFTGVVMGRDSALLKIGLYGYQAGETSFALMDNGSAFFGKAGTGKIWINKEGSDSATIEGGGGGTSSSGMTITLSAATSSDDAIRVGKDNFIVTYGGKLTAKSAVIDGTITAGAGSVIGGWTLEAKRLYSGSGANYVALDSGTSEVNEAIWAGKVDPTTAPFRVTRAGALTATSADITGIIKANTGYIGGTSGWTIDSNKIYGSKTINNKSKYVALSTQGNYALFAGASSNDDTETVDAPFWVKFDGSLLATAAVIQGKITANSGQIAGWVISGNKLQARTSAIETNGSTNLYFDGGPWDASDNNKYVIYMSSSSPSDDNISNTNGKFYVTSSGHMFAQSAEITGTIRSKAGEIGGWSLSKDRLYASGTGRIGMSQTGVQVYNNEGNKIDGLKLVFWSGVSYTKPKVEDEKDATGDEAGLYLRTDNYFGVSSSGKVYCRGAEISGSITATAGTIGGWKITSSKLLNEDGTVYLSASGGLHLGNNFSVSASGALSASGATISGNITASSGRIGNWLITNNRLLSSNGDVYLGPNGFRLTENFQVDSSGNVTLNGTITWGSNSKPWSSDIPDISDFITSSDASTLITNTLVASPHIEGAEIYGGAYHDLSGNANLSIGMVETYYALKFSYTNYGDIFTIWNDLTGSASVALEGDVIFTYNSNSVSSSKPWIFNGSVTFNGNVSGITGITGTFG